MLEPRRRYADVDQVARFVTAVKVNDPRRLFEWQTTKKKIINQTKDCRVQADTECQRDHRNEGEGRRLSEFAKSETEIVHLSAGLSCFKEIIRRGAESGS